MLAVVAASSLAVLAALVVVTLTTTAGAFSTSPISAAGRSQRLPSRAMSASRGVGSGRSIVADDDDDASMAGTYDVLATRLIDRHARETSSAAAAAAGNGGLRNGQLFVAIAGGPGSGKSTLSAAVAKIINGRMRTQTADENDGGDEGDEKYDEGESSSEAPACVVLPMDGFHYSRAYLRSMADDDDNDHSYEELLARRGAPWTFDAEGCVAAFSEARRDGRASLPVYCRERSDPIPDGVRLHEHTRIVLLEGNYLLAWDDERWAPLRTGRVFDETWYVACESLKEQRRRLVRRHLETWSEEKTRIWGEGEAGAGRKADANDMKNLEWIEETSRKYADLVIESI